MKVRSIWLAMGLGLLSMLVVSLPLTAIAQSTQGSSAQRPAAGANAKSSAGQSKAPAATGQSKAAGTKASFGGTPSSPKPSSPKPSSPTNQAAPAAEAGKAASGKATATAPAQTAPSAASSAPSGPQPTGGGATDAKQPKAGGATKPAAAGDVDAATYVVRLRDLESRVDELKEQIRRSHTRLSLLSESVLSAGVGGAEAEIVFRNGMSNAFRVVGVLVVLDGAVQYNETGEEAPHRRQKLTPIFKGQIPPGDHTIQIVVKLQGHGYGVFSYMRSYKPTPKATHSFTVRQGQGIRIEIVAWEQGSATTPIDERPSIRFVERSLDEAEEALEE